MALHHLNLLQGSVFVEFNDFESVDKFLKADPKPTWEDKELLIMTKYTSSLTSYSVFSQNSSGRIIAK